MIRANAEGNKVKPKVNYKGRLKNFNEIQNKQFSKMKYYKIFIKDYINVFF